jgi:hypothetical protein
MVQETFPLVRKARHSNSQPNRTDTTNNIFFMRDIKSKLRYKLTLIGGRSSNRGSQKNL